MIKQIIYEIIMEVKSYPDGAQAMCFALCGVCLGVICFFIKDFYDIHFRGK